MKVKKGARLIVEYEEEYEEDFQIAMLRKNEIFCGASMLALMYAIQFHMPENSR